MPPNGNGNGNGNGGGNGNLAELDYDTGVGAFDMAEAIFGDGVTVLDATYTGATYSSGIYSGGDTVAPGATPNDSGVILSTGRVRSFTDQNAAQNLPSDQTSVDTSGPDNDADFNAIAGTNTYDASYLTVDFIPTSDTMTMQFVFSSDEYPLADLSTFNDMIGVWIKGEHVPLSITGDAAGVDGINDTNNSNLFVDNGDGSFNTEMNGFTLTMTLTIPVIPNEVNTIKIGIADVGDTGNDSNLLIAADSIQTTLVAVDDNVTMQEGVTKTVDLLDNDLNNTTGTLEISHINGVEVSAGDSVTLQSGQIVTLNADGTVSITTDVDHEAISFTYGVESVDGTGAVLQSDTGFVTVDTIPCFVAGTMIQTADGLRAVETLTPGDMVMTRDDGLQPVRWIGQRTVAATGKLAPIRIEANVLGTHGALMLSPLHRVLIKDAVAELLFGEDEVLVAARDLVNDRTIRPVEGGEVTYVHVMFDQHQVIYSEGLATESFLPGPQTTKSFEAEIVEEISTIFPELNVQTGEGYGPAARPLLKRFEAETLLRVVA